MTILTLATTAGLVFSPASAGHIQGDRPEFSTLDINGDGKSDIVVASHTSDAHLSNSGVVYGVLGGHEGGTMLLAQDSDFIIVSESTNDYIGRGIAPAGDLNQDGLSDFWLGASGASSLGKIYLMEGVASPF